MLMQIMRYEYNFGEIFHVDFIQKCDTLGSGNWDFYSFCVFLLLPYTCTYITCHRLFNSKKRDREKESEKERKTIT